MKRKMSLLVFGVVCLAVLPFATKAQTPQGGQSVSDLCKEILHSKCDPARDKLLKEYLGDVDLEGIAERLKSFSGTPAAFDALPKDQMGLVDWSKAVTGGYIQPRGTLMGEKEPKTEGYFENLMVMKVKIDAIPDVIFPHGAHTYWLSCESCHPDPFPKKKGRSNFTMGDIINGKYCGKCHGTVAFAPNAFSGCNRCHNLNKAGATPPWGN